MIILIAIVAKGGAKMGVEAGRLVNGGAYREDYDGEGHWSEAYDEGLCLCQIWAWCPIHFARCILKQTIIMLVTDVLLLS